MSTWKFWATLLLTALVVSLLVRLVAESVSNTNEIKAIEELNGRLDAYALSLERLGANLHPATARRFTADHGLVLISCLELPGDEQPACFASLKAELARSLPSPVVKGKNS